MPEIVRDEQRGTYRHLAIAAADRRYQLRVAPAGGTNFETIGWKAYLGWRSAATDENTAIDEALAMIERLEGRSDGG